MRRRRIAFARIASAAAVHTEDIVRRWLPDGRREGAEWVCRNPLRSDRRAGSFKVNLRTGKWGDFATGNAGGDLISLAAFLQSISQAEAAVAVAGMVGVDAYE
ncbi:hypothetical protein [Methylobacterium nodulans]|uniref:DNA primase n=1 Tax=Methylobacterium nodulans (strain LMG 21967 / CNCM I-2342 / ORS 2060) TaxID=460265 RepID=B8IY35_METNO|nr:hypothetical protein [Methylobacterium nodulans]ACL63325.1 conserved hypothetical protein [Methylobacterium nodulans ORS 2060]